MTETAPDLLRSFIERVERVEEDIAEMNASKSDIYKEAKSQGFDVKIMKKVVSQRRLDSNERDEQDHIFETYWNAVHGVGLVHAHARENIDEFGSEYAA